MKYLILFLIYSFFGVGTEVFFTSVSDYIKSKDMTFQGRSYLWMFPIYGSWGLIIEPLYMAGEFIYGYILKVTIKKCPWEYKTKWTIMGIVNLTHIPFWLVFGYLSELLYRGFISVAFY